jgi:hypothetical protein
MIPWRNVPRRRSELPRVAMFLGRVGSAFCGVHLGGNDWNKCRIGYELVPFKPGVSYRGVEYHFTRACLP